MAVPIVAVVVMAVPIVAVVVMAVPIMVAVVMAVPIMAVVVIVGLNQLGVGRDYGQARQGGLRSGAWRERLSARR